MTNRHIVTVLGLLAVLFMGCAAEMAYEASTEKTEDALTLLTPETFVAGYGGFTVTNVGGGTIQYRSFAKEFPGVRYSLTQPATYYRYIPNYQDALVVTFDSSTPASLGVGCYQNMQVTVCMQLNNPYKDLLCWQFNKHDPTKPLWLQFVAAGSKSYVPWGYDYATGQASYPGVTIQVKYVAQPFYGKCVNGAPVYPTYIKPPTVVFKYIKESYTPDGAI